MALLPYIHIWGNFNLPTFGLLMLLAFIAAYFALEGEITRRKLKVDADDPELIKTVRSGGYILAANVVAVGVS